MAGRTSRYVPPRGVTSAVTRSQATRQNQTPAITGNQGNSRNTSVAIAKLFRPDPLSHCNELGLFSSEAHDIAHQLDYLGMFSAEYTYATTNLQESCLRGEEKKRIFSTSKEAMSLPKATHWKEVIEKEILSLEKHGIYELVSLSFVSFSQKIVGTRWVNKIKAEGTFKSRLVLQGWSQAPGIDFGGTFAPVCRLQNIRMMLAIAAELNYKIHIVDVLTTLLNADVEEEYFVKMPSEYERSNKTGVPLVMKLRKCLYGLRQSPKDWFGTINQCLGGTRFHPLKSYPCVYIYEDKVGFVILTLYLDDLLLLGASKLLLNKLEKQLMDQFEMTQYIGYV